MTDERRLWLGRLHTRARMLSRTAEVVLETPGADEEFARELVADDLTKLRRLLAEEPA